MVFHKTIITAACLVILGVGTTVDAKESQGQFPLLGKSNDLTSGQYTVTKALPQQEMLQRFVHAAAEHSMNSSASSGKTSFVSKNIGSIAPIAGDTIKNLTVSIPVSFVTYDFDDGVYVSATEDDHEIYGVEDLQTGAFEIYADSSISVNSKGDFSDGEIVLTSKTLKQLGFENVKLEKGLFRGTKGYRATSVTATIQDAPVYLLYVYDPELETTLSVTFYEGSSEKESAEIWRTFIKSAFAKSKETKKNALLESEPYENTLFSISLPVGWTTCECEDPLELYLFDSVSYTYNAVTLTPTIYIIGEFTGETTSDLKEYITSAKEVYGESGDFESSSFTSAKMVKTKTGQGVLIQAAYKDDGVPVVGEQLVVIKNGVTYILSAVVPKARWKEYQKAITASLLSIKVK